MVGKGNNLKERPVFIPPRKRQNTKKINGTQNHFDHIKSFQINQKPSPNSPAGLEDDLLKTSLLLKNKQPLPQIPKDQSIKNDKILKSVSSSKIKLNLSNNDIYEMEMDDDNNELQTYQNFNVLQQQQQQHNQNQQYQIRRESKETVTPSSYYSESSLDVKLSKSQDCLTTRSTSSSSKKRVNIRTDILQINNRLFNNKSSSSPASEDNQIMSTMANYEDLESGETSVLNTDEQQHNNSLDRFCTKRSTRSTDSCLTMTGTIKRGRKKGQSLDLQINMSREELEKINAAALHAVEVTKNHNLLCVCTLTTGFHILLLSIICIPFIMIITGIYSFYIGTLTWYNIFTYFNDEKSYLYKLLMSPILIISYPFIILICTIGLGIYAGYIQISLHLTNWLNEIYDIEKGFYGWLCAFLKLPDCSPYEVVILNDLKMASSSTTTTTPTIQATVNEHLNTPHSLIEELSL